MRIATLSPLTKYKVASGLAGGSWKLLCRFRLLLWRRASERLDKVLRSVGPSHTAHPSCRGVYGRGLSRTSTGSGFMCWKQDSKQELDRRATPARLPRTRIQLAQNHGATRCRRLSRHCTRLARVWTYDWMG